MLIDGQRYSFVKASDNRRDGVSLECWRSYSEPTAALVLEAFWHDPSGQFTVRSSGEELPFALLDAFVRKAVKWCSPHLRNEAGTRKLIYMPLLDEAIDVWRPVVAELMVSGKQTRRRWQVQDYSRS